MYQVYMYLWTWHCLTQCSPFHLFQSFSIFITDSTCQALSIQDGSVLCVWLFVQGCGRESSARRVPIIVPSWGRNTPKWWWCTEQVKKKNTVWCAALLPANKCSEKQFECWNGLNICKVQSASLLFITVYLLIYLPRFSYFMYRLKTTRWNAFLLRLQLKML